MKLNLRYATWAFVLALTVAVLVAPAIVAAQSGWDAQGNPVYDKNSPQITPPPRNDHPHGQDGQYGRKRPYGNNIQGVAYNNGFQSGLRYGETDRTSGHSNRPTHSSTYQKGTSGYKSSFGDQTTYKNAFQKGFRAGYTQAYNQGAQGYRR